MSKEGSKVKLPPPSLLNHLRPLRNVARVTGLEASAQDDDPVMHSTIRSPWPDGYQRPLETLEDYQRLLTDNRKEHHRHNSSKNSVSTNDDDEDDDSETEYTTNDDDDDGKGTLEVLNNYLTNDLDQSDIESVCSTTLTIDDKKKGDGSGGGTGDNHRRGGRLKSFGSVFEQIRALPRASSIFPPKSLALLASNSSTEDSAATTGGVATSSDPELLDDPNTTSGWGCRELTEQRNRNYQLVRAWTDEGKYSRVKAMTIACTLYNSKVTDAEIRADLTPKEKYAYRKFCWELEDRLQMITKCDTLSERTLRKVWHLYALYTKALSDEIWDEGNAKSDITSRAIAYLVKRAISGPEREAPSTTEVLWQFKKCNSVGGGSSKTTKLDENLKPAKPIESINPILAKCLSDPIHGFVIVYGRFVSTGKVSSVEKLRKLNFNHIAEDFFERIVEPPIDAEHDDFLSPQYNFFSRKYHRQRRTVSTGTILAEGSKSYDVEVSSGGDNSQQSKKSSQSSHSHHQNGDTGPRGHLHHHVTSQGPNMNLSDMRSLQRKLQMIDGKKRICLVGCRYDVLPQVTKELGFDLVGENDLWNINWSDSPLSPEKIMEMRRIQDTHSVFWGLTAPLQKTNHFPGMYEICRKDRLGRNLNRLKKMYPEDYSFYPPTWDLPTEQSDLLNYARKRKNATFIVKPDSGCQGKGIFLIRNLKNLYPFAKCVCQLYVPHPFLIDGYKFDERIYALITCVDPLRVYIYDEGIARFATVKYNVPTDENLEVVFMHLTNYSLNKFSESYVPEGDGSKRKLSSIYQWMAENGHDVASVIKSIDDIVVKTLMCAAPTLKHNYKTSFPKRDRGSSCFELLGFDILVDRHLNPLLLEVNHSPSFNLDLPVDAEVKTELLKDLLNMVYLGDEISAQAQAIHKRKGRPRRRDVMTPPESVLDIGLPRALQRQFQHEMTHRGKFRLIYSSDKPGKYTRLVDDDSYYCSYPAKEACLLKKRQGPVSFSPDDDPDEWQLRQTNSSVKVTKNGHRYLETVEAAAATTSTQPSPHVQAFKEIHAAESAGKKPKSSSSSRRHRHSSSKSRHRQKERHQPHEERRSSQHNSGSKSTARR